MELAILSTHFMGFDSKYVPPYGISRLMEAAQDRDINVTLVDPSRVYLRITSPDMRLQYGGRPEDVFQSVDAVLVKRTRWMEQAIADLVAVLALTEPGVSVFDPPGTYLNTTSKVTSLITRQARGISHPATVIGFSSDLEPNNVALPTPLLCKSITGTGAKDIQVIRSRRDLVLALEESKAREERAEAPQAVLFQEYLNYDAEYRVLVVGGAAVGMVQRHRAKGRGYNAEHLPEATLVLCDRDADVLSTAEEATAAHGFSFSGVDILRIGRRLHVLECNRSPQFEQFERVTGLDVANVLLDHIVERSVAP